ncbi:MAG: hypothetical protein E4G98_05935 [Promethearchaeota archaeon]|nr:MAG: hypothetical protein E4G98_05935 [Candidatus Lokiarchaeota archaeon]
MATRILELWIIDKSGLSLVHIQSPTLEGKPSINPMLFSGFLTAVESMASESIDSIKMKDSKIVIMPVHQPTKFFVVGRGKMGDKDDNLRKVLDRVKDLFLEEFGEILASWRGNHQIFSFFEEKVIKYFH